MGPYSRGYDKYENEDGFAIHIKEEPSESENDSDSDAQMDSPNHVSTLQDPSLSSLIQSSEKKPQMN